MRDLTRGRRLVVSDYNALNQLLKPSFGEAYAQSINAGVDMVMTAGGLIGFANDLPYEAQLAEALEVARSGVVSAARLDDAVLRVLRVKMALGLLPRDECGTATEEPHSPSPDLHLSESTTASPAVAPLAPPLAPPLALLSPHTRASLEACVGCEAHRKLARAAVSASIVLLKNERGALPLQPSPGASLVVAGRAADDLGMQCGGWTMQWQGERGNTFTTGTSIWQAIRKRASAAASTLVGYDAAHRARWFGGWLGDAAAVAAAATALVVVGEAPYAEGCGDTHEATLASADANLIAAVANGHRRVVVLLICGRPLVIPPPTLALIDALAVAWLPGTEGDGVADVLFGALPPSGRLSFSWPRDGGQMEASRREGGRALYPLGHGLTSLSSPSLW